MPDNEESGSKSGYSSRSFQDRSMESAVEYREREQPKIQVGSALSQSWIALSLPLRQSC